MLKSKSDKASRDITIGGGGIDPASGLERWSLAQ